MTAQAFLADVDRSQDWLQGRRGYRPWFRFPGLNQGGRDQDKRHEVLSGLAARGVLVAPVTIDGSDWMINGITNAALKAKAPINEAALKSLYVETMVQSADFSDTLMRRLIGRSPAHLILLHENDLAARFIGPLVAALKHDGWTIVTADAALSDPIYRLNPDVPAANGTLPAALALEKNAGKPWYYESNAVQLVRKLFEERVLGYATVKTPTAIAPKGEDINARCYKKPEFRRYECRENSHDIEDIIRIDVS